MCYMPVNTCCRGDCLCDQGSSNVVCTQCERQAVWYHHDNQSANRHQCGLLTSLTFVKHYSMVISAAAIAWQQGWHTLVQKITAAILLLPGNSTMP